MPSIAGPKPLAHLAMLIAAGAVAWSCGNSTPSAKPSIEMTATPWASSATASPAASPTASPTPTPTPAPTTPPPTTFPIAVVVPYDDTRQVISAAALTTDLEAGSILMPCELTQVGLSGKALTIPSSTTCLPADEITAKVDATAGMTALLPPGLVTPSVKVLPIDNADLFGGPNIRSVAYPLIASVKVGQDWTRYDVTQIRTLISTGDTCPDTGVAWMAVTKKKGWPWVLDGGTVHYRGTRMDKTYDGPDGNGWPVPLISRNGDTGKVSALISDNDVSANDFECPMVPDWTINTTGVKKFHIDPRVAAVLATEGGLKVVTLGSNHITDGGREGVRQTLDYLDAAGIKHTGAGRTLADALAPAVVDVRGIKFAFVGWDDISGSRYATDTLPGAAPMTDDNVCNSIKAARQVADIVIAMPQWGIEYTLGISKEQTRQRALFYQCGADDVLGSGAHEASWVSITPGANGPQFAIGSHGNFLFTQAWSRQTMEGVIVEATFYGKTLVQFRLHPYVVVDSAQPNLLGTKDGAYVLNQVWSDSKVQ